MKTTILFALMAVSVLSGCGTARTPEGYRDDTGAVLAAKNDAIRACYDGVLKSSPGASGRVTVKFEIETERGELTNVSVDPAATTAPAPVAECVTKNISGLAVTPPDANIGEGTWVYEFTAPPRPKPAPAPASGG